MLELGLLAILSRTVMSRANVPLGVILTAF